MIEHAATSLDAVFARAIKIDRYRNPRLGRLPRYAASSLFQRLKNLSLDSAPATVSTRTNGSGDSDELLERSNDRVCVARCTD